MSKKKAVIHPTAQVHPNARLGEGVEIGAFTCIGEGVRIGSHTQISSSCVLEGDTQVGERCRIFMGVVLGTAPQDLKYKNEPTRLVIGDDNIIREYVTMNRGTTASGQTRVGNKNLFMANSHVAHDCVVGDETVIANVGTLAGHVSVERKAVVGGLVGVHQFVRIGQIAIIGGCSKVVQDVPPYAMADGHPARVYGLNSLGVKRVGLSTVSIKQLKQAFKIIFFSHLSMTRALALVESDVPPDPQVTYLLNFIRNSTRGVCRGGRERADT